jgi:glycosyltransferase involved in cell wall biosynthesis
MHESPTIAVIIPVFNDVAGLERCLKALQKQTYPKELTDIIVVDNGSQADVAGCVARFADVRLIVEQQPGSYAARNRGLSAATSVLLAFTDADCQPQPEWLTAAAEALHAGRTDAVVGGDVELYPLDPERPTWTEIYELAVGFPQRFYIEKRNYSVTANLMTTRRVMDAVGPFDADLKSGGDKEWCHRAVRAGFPISFAPAARVLHPARRRFRQLVKKKLRQASGHLENASRGHARPVAYGIIMLKACAPPVMRMLRMRPMPQLSVVDRLERASIVWLIALALQGATAFELLRRALGKEAER